LPFAGPASTSFPAVDAGDEAHYRAPSARGWRRPTAVARLEQRIQEIVPPGELETINSNIGMPISYNHAFVRPDNTGSQDADVLIALKRIMRRPRGTWNGSGGELPTEFPGSTMYFQPATSSLRC